MTFNTFAELEAFFVEHNTPRYSRSQWDLFLKHQTFEFKRPSIHITGTNGKGSTAVFLQNIYRAHGYKTGLFTSPQLSSALELVLVDGKPLKEAQWLSFFNRWIDPFIAYDLTTFEMQTFFAFSALEEAHCDMSVIEVGMGGITDATNIFVPSLSIITNVTLEHTAYLGDTIEKIIAQKAGIIKAHRPVLVGPLKPSALAIVEAQAKKLQSPVHRVKPAHSLSHGYPWVFDYGPYQKIALTMLARYQVDNAALAIEATEILKGTFPIVEKKLRQALKDTQVPGRLEMLKTRKQVMLDVGHNPGAVLRLIEALETIPKSSLSILFSAFKDKDVAQMIPPLKAIAHAMWLTTFPHRRARAKEDYPNVNLPFENDAILALKSAYQSLPKDGVLLITGSFAFVGWIRNRILQGGLLDD